MTPFTELLTSIAHTPGHAGMTIPEDWMQGRTTYGGLTAALCYEVARRSVGAETPLRTAQVAFIGPSGGDITLTATRLREGRSSTYIGVDMGDGDALCARSVFTFGAARASSLNYSDLPMPESARPADAPSFLPKGQGPAFAQHFDVRLAFGPRPLSGATSASLGLWIRHRDRGAGADIAALLALADAPPPAALSLYATPTMVSSMNWGVDLIDPSPRSLDGWWFARSTAQAAQNGYSAQAMTLWSSEGQLVMTSRQMVAVFG